MSPALGGGFLTAEPQGKSPLSWPSPSSRSRDSHPQRLPDSVLVALVSEQHPQRSLQRPLHAQGRHTHISAPISTRLLAFKASALLQSYPPIRCSDMLRMKFLESPCDSSPQTDLFAAKASPSGLAFQRHSPTESSSCLLSPSKCLAGEGDLEVQWQVCRSRRGVVSQFWGGSPEEEEAEPLLCAFMSQD